MQTAIEQLLERPEIWRGNNTSANEADKAAHHIPSGFAALDAALPGGGFPAGALTEILHARHGIGELRLTMPALARLSRGGRWIAMVAPPFLPYAPALAAQGLDLSRVMIVHPHGDQQALWAIEKALRAGTCAAVLAWPKQCDERSLRRLQLAAEAGNSLGLLFRHAQAAETHSPAALRLALGPTTGQRLDVRILKCRGTPTGSIALDTWTSPNATTQPALTTTDDVVAMPSLSST